MGVRLENRNQIMKRIVFLLGVALFALAQDSSAKEPDVSKLPAPATQQGVTFEKDIKPLVEASCLKCHSGDRPKSKYRMDTVENIIKGGSSGEKAVIVGKSEKSPLVLMSANLIEDMEMPPIDNRDRYPELTKEQIALVRAWIDQGAK
jgi:hypothetical protein